VIPVGLPFRSLSSTGTACSPNVIAILYPVHRVQKSMIRSLPLRSRKVTTAVLGPVSSKRSFSQCASSDGLRHVRGGVRDAKEIDVVTGHHA